MNFEFLGTEAEEKRPGYEVLSQLPLNIGGNTVVIRKVDDYKSRLERLKVRGGSEITCEARFTINSPNDLQHAQDLTDNLCGLLSFASGTLVTWPYFEVFSPNGATRYYAQHRSAVTRDFVASALVDPRQMHDIKVFVESTYNRYVELTTTHRMTQVFHAYTDIQGNNFLEVRGLILISIVDYLTGVLAENTGNNTFIPKELFDKGKDKYKEYIVEAIKVAYPELDKDTANTLINMSQQNFQTLGRKLKLFCKHYKVPVHKDEIKRFIANRNELTHRASFHTSNEYPELASMIHMLNRMILCWLGYNGPYINCTTWEREELFPNPQ
jgi:hypothetical protein